MLILLCFDLFLHHLAIPPGDTYHHAETGKGLDEVILVFHPMEFTRHACERTVDNTNHLAGFGIGVFAEHDVGVAEIGVAQGTKFYHLTVRYLAPLERVFLAEGITGNGTFVEHLHQVVLTVVLFQKNEVMDHGSQHATGMAFLVGLLDVHHGNEMTFAFLGQELADFQFLTVERTEYVPNGRRHDVN